MATEWVPTKVTKALAEKIEAEKIEEMDVTPETIVSRIYRITYADVLEVEKALKKFQVQIRLPDSGELDSATRSALKLE